MECHRSPASNRDAKRYKLASPAHICRHSFNPIFNRLYCTATCHFNDTKRIILLCSGFMRELVNVCTISEMSNSMEQNNFNKNSTNINCNDVTLLICEYYGDHIKYSLGIRSNDRLSKTKENRYKCRSDNIFVFGHYLRLLIFDSNYSSFTIKYTANYCRNIFAFQRYRIRFGLIGCLHNTNTDINTINTNSTNSHTKQTCTCGDCRVSSNIQTINMDDDQTDIKQNINNNINNNWNNENNRKYNQNCNCGTRGRDVDGNSNIGGVNFDKRSFIKSMKQLRRNYSHLTFESLIDDSKPDFIPNFDFCNLSLNTNITNDNNNNNNKYIIDTFICTTAHSTGKNNSNNNNTNNNNSNNNSKNKNNNNKNKSAKKKPVVFYYFQFTSVIGASRYRCELVYYDNRHWNTRNIIFYDDVKFDNKFCLGLNDTVTLTIDNIIDKNRNKKCVSFYKGNSKSPIGNYVSYDLFQFGNIIIDPEYEYYPALSSHGCDCIKNGGIKFEVGVYNRL